MDVQGVVWKTAEGGDEKLTVYTALGILTFYNVTLQSPPCDRCGQQVPGIESPHVHPLTPNKREYEIHLLTLKPAK